MIIPYHELSEEALQALIEDFVTSGGMDYGLVEMSLQEKSVLLLALLEKDDLLISYHNELQSVISRRKKW